MSKRTLRSLGAVLVPGIISTLVFFAFLELVVGRFVPAPLVLFRPSPTNCVQRDALLGTSFRPNCEGEFHGTEIRTNSLGLRGDALRDDGSIRLIVAHEDSRVGDNWIDTAGHRHGVMALRFVRTDGYPRPDVRVVKHADLGPRG